MFLISVPLLLQGHSHPEWPRVNQLQTMALVHSACQWGWPLSWTSEISYQAQQRAMPNQQQKWPQTRRELTALCPIPILSFPKSQRLPPTPLRNVAQTCPRGTNSLLKVHRNWKCRVHQGQQTFPSNSTEVYPLII